jgi:hypothetical protein
MARLTPQEQKQLDDLNARKDAPDDDELSVWVRNGDGHETRLTGAAAKRWLVKNGYDEDDADDSSAGDPLDGKGAGKSTPPAKKAAKKAAPGAAGAGTGEGEEDALDPDAEPPRARPRAFF